METFFSYYDNELCHWQLIFKQLGILKATHLLYHLNKIRLLTWLPARRSAVARGWEHMVGREAASAGAREGAVLHPCSSSSLRIPLRGPSFPVFCSSHMYIIQQYKTSVKKIKILSISPAAGKNSNAVMRYEVLIFLHFHTIWNELVSHTPATSSLWTMWYSLDIIICLLR